MGRLAAAAAGIVGSGLLHVGIAGRADRAGVALLACYLYPKQLPTQEVKRELQKTDYKLKQQIGAFIVSDYRVVTSLSPSKLESKTTDPVESFLLWSDFFLADQIFILHQCVLV